MELFTWPHELSQWIAVLAQRFDARTSGRLGPVFWGFLFSHGRRTVAAWLRGAERSREFHHYHYFLGSVGRKTEEIAARLVGIVLKRLAPVDHILLGIDGTSTKRFVRKVQWAGIHHNPTPCGGSSKNDSSEGRTLAILAVFRGARQSFDWRSGRHTIGCCSHVDCLAEILIESS